MPATPHTGVDYPLSGSEPPPLLHIKPWPVERQSVFNQTYPLIDPNFALAFELNVQISAVYSGPFVPAESAKGHPDPNLEPLEPLFDELVFYYQLLNVTSRPSIEVPSVDFSFPSPPTNFSISFADWLPSSSGVLVPESFLWRGGGNSAAAFGFTFPMLTDLANQQSKQFFIVTNARKFSPTAGTFGTSIDFSTEPFLIPGPIG